MKRKNIIIISICVLILVFLIIFSIKGGIIKLGTSKQTEIKEEKIRNFSPDEMAEPSKSEVIENQKEKNPIDLGVTIELNGEDELTLDVGSTFNDPGAKATNKDNKDISDKIKVDGSVNTNEPGTYKIYYSIGNAIVVREVVVK